MRLQRFVDAAGGSLPRGLRLYRWNSQVASAYWTPLHFVEIAVRNAVHDAMSAAARTPRWFQDSQGVGAAWLYDFEREAVEKASQKVGLSATPGKIVAELHFGFWVGLLSGRYVSAQGGADYHDVIWVRGGVSAMFGGAKRSVVFKRLDRIRRFRNRIAHHEHLLNENLSHMSDDIGSILRTLCPSTAQWVRAMSDVDAVRSRRPI